MSHDTATLEPAAIEREREAALTALLEGRTVKSVRVGATGYLVTFVDGGGLVMFAAGDDVAFVTLKKGDTWV